MASTTVALDPRAVDGASTLATTRAAVDTDVTTDDQTVTSLPSKASPAVPLPSPLARKRRTSSTWTRLAEKRPH
jgi:hypothetical protein